MTLVAISHLEIEGHVFHHGAEIVPGLLSPDTVNKLVDARRVKEYDSAERRSLYRVFAPFSGAKEHEALPQDELTAYGLQE